MLRDTKILSLFEYSVDENLTLARFSFHLAYIRDSIEETGSSGYTFTKLCSRTARPKSTSNWISVESRLSERIAGGPIVFNQISALSAIQ